jgi:hypothetical protein
MEVQHVEAGGLRAGHSHNSRSHGDSWGVDGNGLRLREKLPAEQKQSGQRAVTESTTWHYFLLRIDVDIVKNSKPRTAPRIPPRPVPNVLDRTFAKVPSPTAPKQMGLELGWETVQNQLKSCPMCGKGEDCDR